MHKWFVSAFILSLGLYLPFADAGKKGSTSETKEALQAFQEFIGNWKGSASWTGPTTAKIPGFWTEKSSWSWRFKGKDIWLTFDFETSKLYKGGEVRFQPSTEDYQITLIDMAGKKAVYEGQFKKNVLIVQRMNPENKDIEQIKMNIAGGGDRLVYELWIKRGTIPKKLLQVGYTREGVTFGAAAGGKKPICCVTGGLGTSTVSFGGATYYVCCSGCRDAFNDNPAKIIAEFLKSKKR